MTTDKVTTKPKKNQHRSAAAVSETIKKCNCMPTCSHKFCGCPAQPAWRTTS